MQADTTSPTFAPATHSTSACVHQLFQIQAQRTPDANAVIFEDQTLSYSELNSRANQLAWKLVNRKLALDEAVGICAERSIETIVGILAVLKAGGACLPLDPDYPKDRLAFMLQDGGVRLLLLQSCFRDRLPQSSAQIIELDTSSESQEPTHDPSISSSSDNLAYVIYTSGSTGKPKGVEVPHRGIVRLLIGADYVKLDETKALLQLSALTFDGSIFDIWGALLHGGRSVLYPGRIPSIALLRDLLRKHNVTTAWLTTAVFNTIVDEDPAALSTLEQVLVGGEALSVSHIRRAWDFLPNVQIINAYGPTEATVFACAFRIPSKPTESDTSIPIGVPISRTRAYILDPARKPVPPGVVGELYLGGPGVARGYRNQPDLTAERFIPDPIGNDPCLYQTGDLARWRPDGNIDFLGRIDTQVKLRGFRIELSEIEEIMRHYEGVRDAVAVVDRHPNRESFLSLFVVPKAETRVSEDGIRRFLQQQLPKFMVPARCHVLPQWPLTSSGKVDRQGLIALNSEPGRDNDFAAPCSEVEKKLARIWEGLLNVRPIGIRENFLEIGGNSLLTVRLFARIEETFGARLPVVALLEAPNIEQLAAMIATKRPAEKVAYARPVQPEGGYPSFFCVGAGPLLWPLAAALGRNQPFFSVGIEPDAADLLAPPYQIERLARHMTSAILEKQPHGPYYLGGFCHDGLYAYEVAQQLHRQGHQIGLLALFETECPLSSSKPLPGSGFVRDLGRLKSHEHKFKNFSISKLASSLRDLLSRSRRSLDWKCWSAFPYLYRLRLTRAHKSLEPILYIAGHSYKPQPLNCPVAIFRGTKWPGARVRDAYLGWQDLLSGPCETHEVEGDHAGIFIDAHVKSFAELLSHCLHRAHRSHAA
jgi:amino acid adenylation domain-containing protein